MKEEAMLAINARRYVIEAADSLAAGNLNKAFNLYTKALSITPELKTIYKKQFKVVFMQLVDYLEQTDNNDTLFQIYRQALNIYPNHTFILNDIGRFLLKRGFYLEAWNQFERVLNQKPESVIAEFQMNVVKAHLLHRWHYRMLNDTVRNNLYQIAIQESVEPARDSVLDLGTGTGLLAMYAAQCNPVSVIGIEMDSTLSEIAEHVVKENGFQAIHIINKLSFSVTDTDIGGKHNLLITELFDAGLFGEDVLPSIHHAWVNLLHSDARVMPYKAGFFVRGVQCDSLMTRYYLNEEAKKLLNVQFLKVLTDYDSYDCGDINHYKDLKYMTNPELVLEVDFNDVRDIEIKVNHVQRYGVELKPLMNGVVDTIIGWFTLYLTDKTSLTTDPTSEHCAKAWQQAIFCTFLPKQVEENCPFPVYFHLLEGKRLDLAPEIVCNAMVTESVMRFLNDKKYIEMILSCVDTAFAYLQSSFDMSEVAVADLSPFPMFGLMMVKKGVKTLFCQSASRDDSEFFETVFKANDIQIEQYRIIDSQDTHLENQMFHSIFTNVFDISGDINRMQLKNIQSIKINNLIEGGLLLPHSINVMGQLINSPNLNMCNRVYDENTKFTMAHHMNKFQLSANYGIDYTHLEFTALSDPVELGICGGMKSGVTECPVLKAGSANALLCWYNIEVVQNCGFITTSRPDCFIDTIAFLANPEIAIAAGGSADLICCVDKDQAFKYIIDVHNDREPTVT